MKTHTWAELKRAAEDIQRTLLIDKPPLSANIKVNNAKLDAWITEAIGLIAPGDEFSDPRTLEVLQDEFAFEMPEWDSSGEVEEEESYEEDPEQYDPTDYIPDPPDDDPSFLTEYLEEEEDPSIEDIDTIE